ncbi:MAG: sn-glycerol-1-phosphate dehydrogenase [Clostridia bacterium]|nr:sn-glycerol-1-phosphate dehydrogenase [Clostridia bacterium]
MSLEMMESLNGKMCGCGKLHTFTSKVVVGQGVISKLPQIVKDFNVKKAFVIADKNTYKVAGETVCRLLENNSFIINSHVYRADSLEPDEANVGLAIMNFNTDSDIIIGVGSGVINDIGKIVASVSNKPYIIVATAPSMDGYASATSSMTCDGLKKSLPSKCADVIIGDTDILCDAPLKMLSSGVGDMLAKYVSICEWRISNIINGEYYCEEIAELVRKSLKKCIDNADGLLKRDKAAVASVFEGLVVCGAAMKYAGVSRPASGVEHYLSHIWDMRAVEFGTPCELHGIQCALGTAIALKIYEKVLTFTPDKAFAIAKAEQFDYEKWSDELRRFLGKGAESMIAIEEKEGKYNLNSHKKRFEIIIGKWDKITQY